MTLALVWGLQSGLAAPALADTATTLCTATNGPYGSAGVGGGYLLNTDEWNSSADLCMRSDGGADFTVTSSELTPATR